MDLTFASEDQATNWALDWLIKKGFHVTLPAAHEKRTPLELAILLGLCDSTINKRLHSRWCPPYQVTKSANGKRILTVTMNPALWEFLRKPKQPGKPLER